MIDFYAQKQVLAKVEDDIKTLYDAFDVDGCREELAHLTEESKKDDFWQDVENAQKVNRKMNVCQKKIKKVEDVQKKYLETKDICYWKELLRILPNSWLQTRTWTGNYEILHNIYHQRKNHKLSEWHTFLDIIVKELP